MKSYPCVALAAALLLAWGVPVRADDKDDKKVAARLAKYDLKPVYTGSTVSSGPSFVTKDNLAPVQKYAGSYR